MKSSKYVKRQLFEIRLISVISFVFVAFCQPRILRYSARDVTDIFAIRHKTKNALHSSDTTRARFDICYNHTNISVTKQECITFIRHHTCAF